MATRSLGTLTLDMILKLGGYEAGLDKAARISEKRMKQIATQASAVGNTIGTFLSRGIDLAFKSLGEFITLGAGFQDIAEKIGDTGEAVASLKTATDVSGVSFDTVAAASIKLTAALSKTDDEAKGVGNALAAIGLNLEDFKKLSPVEQIDAVAKALAGFEDGANKTAVAVALFGKSGAELLPFLNDLADGAERQTTATQEQIDAANELEETLNGLRGSYGNLKIQIAGEIIPVIRDVVKVFADLIREVKLVGGDNSIREFAQSAALGFVSVIEFINRTIQTLNALRGSLQVVVNDIRVVSNALGFLNPFSSALKGGTSNQIDSFKALLEERNKTLDAANQRYANLVGTNFTLVSDSLKKTFDEQKNYVEKTNALPKPKLNFTAVVDKEADKAAKEAKKNADAIQAVIDRLNEQNTTFGQTAAQSDIYTLSQLKASESQIALAQSLANSIDAKQKAAEVENYLVGLREEAALVEATTEKTNAYKLSILGATQAQIDEASQLSRSIDEQKKFNDLKQEAAKIIEASRTPLQEYQAEIQKLNELLGKGLITQGQYNQAVIASQDAFDKAKLAADPWAKEMEAIADQAARNIQDSFADFLFDPFEGGLKGMLASFEQTLRRMVAEAAAAQIFKALAGSFTGGGGGGFWDAILSIGGGLGVVNGAPPIGKRAMGGPVQPGRTYLVGENGPELFSPNGTGTIIPNGGGMTQNINISIAAPAGTVDRRTMQNTAAEVARAARNASMRNG